MIELLELWRCTECGYVCRAEPDGSIGTIHAHAEKHTGFFSIADVDALDDVIEFLKVSVDFSEDAKDRRVGDPGE